MDFGRESYGHPKLAQPSSFPTELGQKSPAKGGQLGLTQLIPAELSHTQLIPAELGHTQLIDECKTHLCFEFISHAILCILYPYSCETHKISSKLGFVGLLMKSK